MAAADGIKSDATHDVLAPQPPPLTPRPARAASTPPPPPSPWTRSSRSAWTPPPTLFPRWRPTRQRRRPLRRAWRQSRPLGPLSPLTWLSTRCVRGVTRLQSLHCLWQLGAWVRQTAPRSRWRHQLRRPCPGITPEARATRRCTPADHLEAALCRGCLCSPGGQQRDAVGNEGLKVLPGV